MALTTTVYGSNINGKTISATTATDGKTISFTADGSTFFTYNGKAASSVVFLDQIIGRDLFAVKETRGGSTSFHVYATDGTGSGTHGVVDVNVVTGNTTVSLVATLNGRDILDFHNSDYGTDLFYSVSGLGHDAQYLGGISVGHGTAYIADSGNGYILLASTDAAFAQSFQTDGTSAHSSTSQGTVLDFSPQVVTLGNDNDTYVAPGYLTHTVNGGGGDDLLIGNDNVDSLNGEGGNDTLYGHDGFDHLSGGAGSDYLHDFTGNGNFMYGDAGNDTVVGEGYLFGGDDNDYLSVNSHLWLEPNETLSKVHSYVDGGQGDDTLEGDASTTATLVGGAGNDIYYVYQAGDTITENVDEGHDTVWTTVSGITLSDNVEDLFAVMGGDPLGFVLTGNAQNNHIMGNQANDTLSGGDGNDTLFGDGGHDSIDGGAGNDSIDVGTSDRSTLIGGAGDDTIRGSGILDGGDGSDVIFGNGGYTEVTLGTGFNDEYIASNRTNPENRYENIYFSGNMSDYTIMRDPDAPAYLVWGPDGTAQINGYTLMHFNGGPGVVIDTSNSGVWETFDHDTVVSGTSFSDWILVTGADSNATIHGGAGNDTLAGLGGTFVASGDAGDDVIQGGRYNDTLSGGDGHDFLRGFEGNDSISGGKDIDVLMGMDGNDTLDGGAGADTMSGGAGDDNYYVDNSGDIVSEVADFGGGDAGGTDRVYATVSYTLGAGVEHLTLTGAGNIDGTGNDLQNNLFGNGADNVLSGLGGNDKIKGGGGNDTIVGGVGNDILEGGDGADRFVFSAASVNGKDTIQDFVHGVDKLVFATADYGSSAFTAGTAAVGSGAQFVWNETTHTLSWDHDGAGGDLAIQIAVFSNGAHIDASDLLFV